LRLATRQTHWLNLAILWLALGGAGICWNSLQAVGARHAPPSAAAIVVLGVAIIIRSVMSAVKFRVGRRIRSASLVAAGWNDTLDILAAGTALTAVALAMYDSARFLAADHYGGFAVGIIVVATGVRVLRDASLELMDTMPGSDLIERSLAEAASVPGVVGIDKSRARCEIARHGVGAVLPCRVACESVTIRARVSSFCCSAICQNMYFAAS
jgi:divalent metal cation (Fe/Co/Zn/Cd) transporter